MTFSIEFITAPAGCFASLYASGVTEPIWLGKYGVCLNQNVERWIGVVGFGQTEEEARLDLLKDAKKVIKQLEKKADPRPSQVRTLEMIKVALGTI